MIVDERCEGCLHCNLFYDSEPFYLRSEECRECLKKRYNEKHLQSRAKEAKEG